MSRDNWTIKQIKTDIRWVRIIKKLLELITTSFFIFKSHNPTQLNRSSFQHLTNADKLDRVEKRNQIKWINDMFVQRLLFALNLFSFFSTPFAVEQLEQTNGPGVICSMYNEQTWWCFRPQFVQSRNLQQRKDFQRTKIRGNFRENVSGLVRRYADSK